MLVLAVCTYHTVIKVDAVTNRRQLSDKEANLKGRVGAKNAGTKTIHTQPLPQDPLL
jgi:hypothetical protein